MPLDNVFYIGGTQRLSPPGRKSVNEGSEYYDSDADEDIEYENPQTGERGRKRAHSPSTQANGSTKRSRTKHGRTTVHKPITDPLHRDDQSIVEWKHQGFTNAWIADKLDKDGRSKFSEAAIQSRWVRIRNMKEKEWDEDLDDNLSDWHQGEDEHLEAAIEIAEEKFKRELEKLEIKKWQDCAVTLFNRLKHKKKKYTDKACKERWEGLHNGTALIPIEMDLDQAGREIMRKTRIAEAKRVRAEERLRVRQAKEAEKNKKTTREHEKKVRFEAKVVAREAREAEKAETQRLKEERAAGKAKQAAAREQARKDWVAAIAEKRRIVELEERAYRNISGKMLNRFRANGKTKRGDGSVSESDTEEDSIDENLTDAEAEENNGDEDGDSDDRNMVDLTSDRHRDQFPDGSDGEGSRADGASSRTKAHVSTPNDFGFQLPSNTPDKATFKKAKITQQTLENPRSIMTYDELKTLIFQRSLNRPSPGETQPRLVARLATADAMLTVEGLDDLVRKHAKPKRERKELKTARLAGYDAEKSAAGQAGVKATDLKFKKGYEGYVGKFSYLIDNEPSEEPSEGEFT